MINEYCVVQTVTFICCLRRSADFLSMAKHSARYMIHNDNGII